MSDTPRTDAAIIERCHIHKMCGCVELLELVDADVARKLERERDEARRIMNVIERDWKEKCIEADTMRQHYKNSCFEIEKLKQERDEARKLSQWFYKRLKQICLDHPIYENVDGTLARLEEAAIDDPWLQNSPKNI